MNARFNKKSVKISTHAKKINRTSNEDTEGNPKIVTGLETYNCQDEENLSPKGSYPV
jgi:hypothetical protein